MIWGEIGVLNSLLTIQPRSQGQGNVARMFSSLAFRGDFGNYRCARSFDIPAASIFFPFHILIVHNFKI